MARYKFTAKDLRIFAPFLEHPIAKAGLTYIRPVKRFAAVRQVSKLRSLPVPIQSRDDPDGVPLDRILKAVQAEVPGVTSIVVKQGRVIVKRKGASDEAADAKIRKILTDKKKLEGLRPPVLRSTLEKAVASGGRESLQRILLESETPDADWLLAFRAYAVKHLIKHE